MENINQKPDLLNRRQFVNQTGQWVGLGAAITLLKGCNTNEVKPNAPVNFSIDLTASSNAALQKIGGAVIVQGVIIIRKAANDYVALSTRCTHDSCTVNYSTTTTQLVCPCHGSIFNNSGQVLHGPATTSLPHYSVTVSGNTLTVKS